MTASASHPVEVFGRPLKCPVCGHDRFWDGDAQLMDTALAQGEREIYPAVVPNPMPKPTYRTVIYYACERCGNMLWFLKAIKP
jgi:hypothetical protein